MDVVLSRLPTSNVNNLCLELEKPQFETQNFGDTFFILFNTCLKKIGTYQ